MRRVLCAAAVVFLVACGEMAPGGDETFMVHVGHNRVEPVEMRIPAGSVVIFHNMDEMPGGHTIVADDGSFESPPLAKDEQWSHTFEQAGSFGYRIKQHPEAKGTVTVK